MNETEELMTAAMAKQAERTLPPAPVLAALTKPRRRRIRPLVVAVAVACAVAAITIPIAMRPQPTTLPADLARTGIPIKVKAENLPGYDEVRRFSTVDGASQFRRWEDPTGTGASIASYTTWSAEWHNRAGCGSKGEPTTVKGLPAHAMLRGVKYEVSWMAEKDLCVVVEADEGQHVAMQIAESIRPDGESTIKPWVTFGWLPEGMTPGKVDLTLDPAGIVSINDAHGPDRSVQVYYVPDVMPNYGGTVVGLPGDNELRFGFTGLTDGEKQRIMDETKLVPNPDLSWITR